MTNTAAAHIITADAVALGAPQVIVMTVDEGTGAEVLTTMNIPANYANDLDEIQRGMPMFGWRATGDPVSAGDGYWIVDVERAP